MGNFFFFRSAWIFVCAFQVSSIRLVCTLVLRKMRTKYWSVHNKCNKVEQEHFSQKQNTGEHFTTKLKSTSKNSGGSEGKKNSPEKSLRSVLHQAIQFKIFFLNQLKAFVWFSWHNLNTTRNTSILSSDLLDSEPQETKQTIEMKCHIQSSL